MELTSTKITSEFGWCNIVSPNLYECYHKEPRSQVERQLSNGKQLTRLLKILILAKSEFLKKST